ncbi:MAG TPA: hypothetical protein PK071_02580 [Atopobiaceae bacterium]|nr:hypothetical protein [Atopobiaceae bacterium]
MEKIRNRAISLLLVVSAGALLYHFGLTKEARASIRKVIGTVHAAYIQIGGTLSDINGTIMDEDMLPNRASTISQWEKLGY